jgi:hypothetical protein
LIVFITGIKTFDFPWAGSFVPVHPGDICKEHSTLQAVLLDARNAWQKQTFSVPSLSGAAFL